MNLSTKTLIVKIADQRRGGISLTKGPEYAGSAASYSDADQDVLANFKRQGIRWGTDALLPMGVYFGKHIDSIETFVREATVAGITLDEQRSLAGKGEGILSRLDDARNYLDLMECLLVDLGILDGPVKSAFEPGTEAAWADEHRGHRWVEFGECLDCVARGMDPDERELASRLLIPGPDSLIELCRTDGTPVDKCRCSEGAFAHIETGRSHVGDVSPFDVEEAVHAGASGDVADDYNYLRRRVEELTDDLRAMRSERNFALGEVERLAERVYAREDGECAGSEASCASCNGGPCRVQP